MSVDKELLKRLKLLYVEDDDLIRTELADLLSNFFDKVFQARDGKAGLETYLKNKDDIDIILTDINMPKLNGLEMVKTIREIDKNIPVFLATAHSDNEFLAEAIKLRIHEYIVKPIDIRNLLSLMNELANTLYQESILEQQNKELERYKEILDSNNIVIKTDIHMNITYVNEQFCQVTGYDKNELLGQEFKSLKHPDFSNDIYTDMFATVLNNKPWHGQLKNIAKDNSTYHTDTHMIPVLSDGGDIIGAISIQRDITSELNKKRNIQLALMKDKSDIFIKSKEGSAEQSMIINDLKKQLEIAKKELYEAQSSVDKYIYTAEKATVENRNLRRDLAVYKKQVDVQSKTVKIVKENNDLKQEISRLKNIIDEHKEKSDKELKQLNVNYQVELDELEKQLEELNDKLSAVESDEILLQKLEYWKTKAKSESARIEALEKQIIAHGDKSIMSKIFG